MKKLSVVLLCLLTCILSYAQPVTGVWRGKISSGRGMFANSCKVELKLVKNGDSLVGSVYYFMNASNYIRYEVRGYLDNRDYAVHWWDQKLVDVKPAGNKTVMMFENSMQSDASFNCPNPKVMKLDGVSHIGKGGPEFVLQFDKIEKTIFPDEWDNVIGGYFAGMADPDIIDSVGAIAKEYVPVINDKPTVAKADRSSRNKKDEQDVPQTFAATDDLKTRSTSMGNAEPAAAVATNTKKDEPGTTPGTPKDVPVEKPSAAQQTVKNTPPPATKPANEPAQNTIAKKTETDVVKPGAATQKPAAPPATNTAITTPPASSPSVAKKAAEEKKQTPNSQPIVIPPVKVPERIDPVAVKKFETRKRISQGELPILGDSIELNFYDNAEIDGDSISVFLNGKMLFNHVMLSAQAYTFKIPTKDLASGSELAMVAENLGSIPPNTAYMVAIVDGQRYSVRLESTEQSSGTIRLVRR